ncbi:MAG: class I SAM-dependent methyltransferase [Gammaproteobacteria bacterium]|nr:class I SAM-dependent methyltransferase [Gammaproteobacteria bacterium]
MSDIYSKDFFDEKCSYIKDGVPAKTDSSEQAKLMMKVFGPKKILDCGCATGIYEYGFFLLNSEVEIVGFDISEYALEHCIPEVKDRLFLLDIEKQKISYPDNYFDLVLCFDFLEHLHSEYMDFAIKEITRVCSKIIFCRQPFCKFRLHGEKLRDEFLRLNELTNSERIALINKHPLIFTTSPDPNCPYHPSERDREYFIEKFSKHGYSEIFLDESFYKYPNALGLTSWTTLVLEKI